MQISIKECVEKSCLGVQKIIFERIQRFFFAVVLSEKDLSNVDEGAV